MWEVGKIVSQLFLAGNLEKTVDISRWNVPEF